MLNQENNSLKQTKGGIAMQYNYTIPLKLRCASPRQSGSFKDHEKWFKECVNEFNKRSDNSTINRKKIKVEEIYDKEIEIKLYTETNLGKAPGRSLTMLSRTLIDEKNTLYDPYFSEQLFHGKLFTIEVIEAQADEIQMSDGELIKALVDYGMTPKSNILEKQKKAVEQMKKLAIESGIFKSQQVEISESNV